MSSASRSKGTSIIGIGINGLRVEGLGAVRWHSGHA